MNASQILGCTLARIGYFLRPQQLLTKRSCDILNILALSCEEAILIKYRLTNEAPTDLNVTFNN